MDGWMNGCLITNQEQNCCQIHLPLEHWRVWKQKMSLSQSQLSTQQLTLAGGGRDAHFVPPSSVSHSWPSPLIYHVPSFPPSSFSLITSATLHPGVVIFIKPKQTRKT